MIICVSAAIEHTADGRVIYTLRRAAQDVGEQVYLTLQEHESMRLLLKDRSILTSVAALSSTRRVLDHGAPVAALECW